MEELISFLTSIFVVFTAAAIHFFCVVNICHNGDLNRKQHDAVYLAARGCCGSLIVALASLIMVGILIAVKGGIICL